MEPIAEIVALRHGKTNYREANGDLGEHDLDLTPEGVVETQQRAEELRLHLAQFDCILVLSSPAARARHTAQIFVEQLGADFCRGRLVGTTRISPIVNQIRFKNESAFWEHMNRVSTSVYGEAWLHDPTLADENNMAEARKRVDRRAIIFLSHMTGFVRQLSAREGKSVCILVFSHNEIITRYLLALYAQEQFPSVDAPVAQNSEALHIAVHQDDSFTVQARGRCGTFKLVNGQFIRIS